MDEVLHIICQVSHQLTRIHATVYRYNDHHFHYGYMVYAAAIVANHRPEWAREYFDRILLYVRDIANPSSHDKYFPMFRQKDWYLGNSWAAGLMSAELSPHGREQESSSEAIAAFEGIALLGNVMVSTQYHDGIPLLQTADHSVSFFAHLD